MIFLSLSAVAITTCIWAGISSNGSMTNSGRESLSGAKDELETQLRPSTINACRLQNAWIIWSKCHPWLIMALVQDLNEVIGRGSHTVASQKSHGFFQGPRPRSAVGIWFSPLRWPVSSSLLFVPMLSRRKLCYGSCSWTVGHMLLSRGDIIYTSQKTSPCIQSLPCHNVSKQ